MTRQLTMRRAAGVPSERARAVARWFDVPVEAAERRGGRMLNCGAPKLEAGVRSVLITGPSGAGKTTLLRRLRRGLVRQGVMLLSGEVPRACRRGGSGPTWVIDLFPQLSTEEALRLLARVGLGEVGCYLRPPGYLSRGQRVRLWLAVAFAQAMGTDRQCLLAVDELGGGLDEVTAFVVCRGLSKLLADHRHVRLIAATSRAELAVPLRPDAIVRCDFGRLWPVSAGEGLAEELHDHCHEQQD